MRQTQWIDAMREALREEMQADSRVVIIGSGVRISSDGVTAGLVDEFGAARVLESPVSEAAIAGIGAGAAMTGLRPVIHMGLLGFSLGALDQVANEAAKIYYKFGGQVPVPVVYLFGTAFRGWGPQHAQSVHAVLTHLPGLKVVFPSTPQDAKGLLKQAIRDNNPVAYLIHQQLTALAGPVPDGDCAVAIGRAAVVRAGADLTVITCGEFVHRSLAAAERWGEQGVSVEVIDLQTLVPLDWETLATSARKTGRVVVYDEGHFTGGIAATVAAGLQQRVFGALKAPVATLTAADVSLPYNSALESEVIPSVARLMQVMQGSLHYRTGQLGLTLPEFD